MHSRSAMRMRELVGTAVGWMWAPAIAAVAAVKRARFFHPEGTCYSADIRAMSDDTLAAQMAGQALVRLSPALWRHGKEWPDVLGCAIRFGWVAGDNAGTQDLLFATARSPLSVWFAPLSTQVHDYLANDYFAVSPFDAPGLGRVKWRLRPEPGTAIAGSRAAKLNAAVASGRAIFTLAVAHGTLDEWHSFARIELRDQVFVDQAALRFSPFRTGLGIVPRGFVHALRHGAYAASQAARAMVG